jgi:RNA polymerase sigma factor (sigma-70 family)
LEASALTHASRRGLLVRRSRLLRLQKDDRLVAMMRNGHERAFEVLFERYHARLLAFCQHMVSCREDAEDVLQEVFVAAHNAILADNRSINVRPWLYRIARNRCLNHLRKPVPEGQDSMDIHPHENGASTAERVQNREEFRRLIADVQTLPETQRTALLLREIDAMTYEEIAQAMDTTVPSIKSLLVRARITLAESSQARLLTCGEVQLELAEAAEGLRKVSGPVRRHVRSCAGCTDFRSQLRADSRALAALFPVGSLLALKELLGAKLAAIVGGGSSGGGAAAGGAAAGGATAGGAGAAAGGAAAGGAAAGAAAGGAALGGAAAGGGIGGALVGGLGAKTAAGVATAALLTAGAVEVKKQYGEPANQQERQTPAAVNHSGAAHAPQPHHGKPEQVSPTTPEPSQDPPPAAEQYEPPVQPPAEEVPATEAQPAPAPAPVPAAEPSPTEEPAADQSAVDPPPAGDPVEEGSGEVEVVPVPAPEVAPPLPPAESPPAESPQPVPAPEYTPRYE